MIAPSLPFPVKEQSANSHTMVLLYGYMLLPERDYAIANLSVVTLSVVCLLFATFVYPTQVVKTFGNISLPFCTLATL